MLGVNPDLVLSPSFRKDKAEGMVVLSYKRGKMCLCLLGFLGFLGYPLFDKYRTGWVITQIAGYRNIFFDAATENRQV